MIISTVTYGGPGGHHRIYNAANWVYGSEVKHLLFLYPGALPPHRSLRLPLKIPSKAINEIISHFSPFFQTNETSLELTISPTFFVYQD